MSNLYVSDDLSPVVDFDLDPICCVMEGAIYSVRMLIAGSDQPCDFIPCPVAVDTCASVSLIREADLPPGVMVAKLEHVPRIRDAQKSLLKILGSCVLHVSVGDVATTHDFLVVPSLPVPALVGVNFISKHVTAILPPQRLMVFGNTTVTMLDSLSQVETDKYLSTVVRSSSDVMIPAMSEVAVGVMTTREGLSLIRPCVRRTSDRCFAPNGLAELPPRGTEFLLKVGNLSDRPRLVRAGQIVAVAENVSTVRSVADSADESWKEKLDLSSMPEPLRPQVLSMLEKHSGMWNGNLGSIDGVKHRIETSGAPVHGQPYRAGLKSRELIAKEIERMQTMGVIEEAEGEWASPVVLVPKSDGTMRFCVDYRRLNAITKRDVYPLPRMDDCLDSLGGATVFSTIDANCGYWQVGIDKCDKPKTAFTTHCGTYQFTRMPFGLSNAPATFQRALDVILRSVRWSTAIVYLDDVIVFSSSHEQHLLDVDRVLTLLGRAGVSLKFSKCSFFQPKVAYLGHIVSAAGFEVDQSKTSALRSCRAPTNKSELRSFLGLANVYRRFVPDFAKNARPLTLFLKKDGPERFELDEAQMDAFCTLKDLLCSAEVLALPVVYAFLGRYSGLAH